MVRVLTAHPLSYRHTVGAARRHATITTRKAINNSSKYGHNEPDACDRIAAVSWVYFSAKL
jgi:hypothetical protein